MNVGWRLCAMQCCNTVYPMFQYFWIVLHSLHNLLTQFQTTNVLSHIVKPSLHVIFTAIVLSVVTYALPSFAGQLSKGDKARIDSLFQKVFRWGFCCQTLSIDELICAVDNKLFRRMSSQSYCLYRLLPTQRNNILNCFSNHGHNYLLPQINQLYSRTVS